MRNLSPSLSSLPLKCGDGQWRKRECRKRVSTKGMCFFTMHILRFSPEGSFLINMMSFPDMIRNVAVVGHLHHGKTALLDMLVFETHKIDWNADNQA